jgi:hypothetical protein
MWKRKLDRLKVKKEEVEKQGAGSIFFYSTYRVIKFIRIVYMAKKTTFVTELV